MLFPWHMYPRYKSNVTNRELLFLGTDPQPKLGSATFCAVYLHCRGNTDLNQQRVCFDGAPTFQLSNNLLREDQRFAVFMPLLQNLKISLYELLVQVPIAL